MAHKTLQVLTTLAAVALFGFTLTGCTARWSGEIELEVHRLGLITPIDRTGPKTTTSYLSTWDGRTTESTS